MLIKPGAVYKVGEVMCLATMDKADYAGKAGLTAVARFVNLKNFISLAPADARILSNGNLECSSLHPDQHVLHTETLREFYGVKDEPVIPHMPSPPNLPPVQAKPAVAVVSKKKPKVKKKVKVK